MPKQMSLLPGILIMIFICLNNSISLCQTSIKKCDKESCKNPSSFIDPDHQKINIEMTRTRFTIKAAPKKVGVVYAKRNWLTIYCYDGGSIDSNTGCYEKITPVLPTCRELRDWRRKGFCKTGIECAPDGVCWGSGANVCLERNPTIVNNIGPKFIKWAGERWMSFPHHTCVSSWECLALTVDVDIFAEIVGGKEVFYYIDRDNKKHIYQSTLYVDGDEEESGGNIQCLVDEVIPYVPETIEATCFGESREKVKCILISNSEWDGIVIDLHEAEVSVLRNAIFHLVGPLYIPDGSGKIINIGKTETSNSYKEGLSKVYELTRSADIEDILELSYSLTASQMQTIYNLLEVSERVVNIERAIIRLVKSLSLFDPSILHKITGGNPYYLKWQTPDIFETCPCYDLGEFENSNCNSEYMFIDGAYVYKNDTSLCKHYYKEEIQNVSLFKNIKIDTSTINVLPPQTSSSDSLTWDSLSDWRNDKMEKEHTSHSYDNLSDKLEDLYNMIGMGAINKWFWTATAIVAWLSGVIVIGTALCRYRAA